MIKPPYLKKIYWNDQAEPGQERHEYPLNTDLFKDQDFSWEFSQPITIITGENGTGKSTLLEGIADNCGFNLSGGGQEHHGIKQRNDVESLRKALRFGWTLRVRQGFFMRAESLYNFATHLDDLNRDEPYNYYSAVGGKSLHERSHGEAFLSVLQDRFTYKGIYILDEPEAALSPSRQLSLLALLHEAYQQEKTQIIIATHSPILLSFPYAQICEVQNGKIVETPYKETAHYTLYKRFLDEPEKYHDILFNEYPSHQNEKESF
ncbi:MAG: AAA family ATPase [Bdellovibrionales bacterium]